MLGKGYWVFYPRYRGAWESGGQFLEKSPHLDIKDVIDELPKGFKDAAYGQRFSVYPDEIFVIGGSFGGAAAILSSLDTRVTKVIANCAVVDWAILDRAENTETSNPSYCSLYSRGVWVGLSAIRKELEKAGRRGVLQSFATYQ